MKNKRIIDETGNIYGSLTVIRQAGNTPRGGATWLCQCECGNEAVVRGAYLRSGKSKSCGCHGVTGEQASFNALYSNYKKRAKKKKLIFELTKEDFSFITKMNCHYCGVEPKQEGIIYGKAVSVGSYVYNGVDRIDNSKGYILSNIVPCCGVCNIAKRFMSREEFLAWTERVCRFQHSRMRKLDDKISR